MTTKPAAKALRRVATFSWALSRGVHTKALIGCDEIVYRPLSAKNLDAVVGWGLKDNTLAAAEFAHRHQLPLIRLEDGFLRSVDLGVQGDTALSMVRDDAGMYYDARSPSALETLLASDTPQLQDPELLQRSERAIAAICQHQLSKYNNSPVAPVQLDKRPRVLVVDQTAGDLSVSCGLGHRNIFADMLSAAIAENPEAEILVKTHPDVVAGKKSGYLGAIPTSDRIRVFTSRCNPIALLAQVDHVYVVTSQLGFEALMVGKPVTCFGAPFYAGWGLTEDRLPLPRRVRKRGLPQVFAAAYILYSRYVDPDTGAPTQLERVIEHLALQRTIFARNRGRMFCFGFHFWKHKYVRAYLRCPDNEVVFARSAKHAHRLGFDEHCQIVQWGQRGNSEAQTLAERHNLEIWRMEDGFLRSVGLGSDMSPPASLVVDNRGIYYDPRTRSELEGILQEGEFAPALLAQAATFRARLLETGLSKYNAAGSQTALQIAPGNRKILLVPGQVEDDASIALGCVDIGTNLALLQAARNARPDAFIIFKPHPDVLSGNRHGNVDTNTAKRYCDHIEEDAPLALCLQVCDEVHVMTSLVGFEALLREKTVHTYGLPFYAGWGLTQDRHDIVRRTRKLTLDQLVAATYLLYPRYLNRETHRFTTAMVVMEQLDAERELAEQTLKVRWPHRQLRKLRNIAKEVL